MRVLVEGVRQMHRVAASPPLSDIVEEERAPASEEAESWIRANVQTVYHPVGSCALGKVVDDELRVRGLEGIRVVDGSVVPNLMRGHPHPQISMVAMRAAELIRRAPSPTLSSA
jgi:choline dehydrogenase-like flavoprotein